MIKASKIGVEEILSNELLEDNRLTPNMKLVLAQAILYTGLDKNKPGEFFRSNKDFSRDTGIETSTFRFIIQKLINLGLLERITGSRENGASIYKLDKSLYNLNPFITIEKSTAPRIQTTEDEGNYINKLPSDSRFQKTEYTVEISEEKETSMNMIEKPYVGFSSYSDKEKELYFEKSLKECDAKTVEMYRRFAEKGQEWFDWFCDKIYQGSKDFYNGTIGSREHIARNYHLTIPSTV